MTAHFSKKKTIFTMILCAAIPIFSLEFPAASFEVTPFFSSRLGWYGEHLYTKVRNAEHPMTSYLEWQQNSVFTFGTKAEGRISNFYLNGECSFGIPMRTGLIYDYDWFMNTNICQSLSVGEENLIRSYDFGGSISYLFPLKHLDFMISAGCSYAYVYFDSPENQYGRADPHRGDSDVISYDSEEAVIFSTCHLSYERYTFYSWLGGEFRYHPSDKLSFNLAFSLSPYSSTESEDHHDYDNDYDADSGEYFQDVCSGFFWAYKFSAGCRYYFSKYAGAYTGARIVYMPPIYGRTYTSGHSRVLGSLSSADYVGASEFTCTFFAGIIFRVSNF